MDALNLDRPETAIIRKIRANRHALMDPDPGELKVTTCARGFLADRISPIEHFCPMLQNKN